MNATANVANTIVGQPVCSSSEHLQPDVDLRQLQCPFSYDLVSCWLRNPAVESPVVRQMFTHIYTAAHSMAQSGTDSHLFMCMCAQSQLFKRIMK